MLNNQSPMSSATAQIPRQEWGALNFGSSVGDRALRSGTKRLELTHCGLVKLIRAIAALQGPKARSHEILRSSWRESTWNKIC